MENLNLRHTITEIKILLVRTICMFELTEELKNNRDYASKEHREKQIEENGREPQRNIGHH